MITSQNEIIEILNRRVFVGEKADLLQAVAKYPDRFVGVFRSTSPGLKLLQNLLQSREIRFGDALEEIITKLLSMMEYENLEKSFRVGDKDFRCDQYFRAPDGAYYYLVEQKVRDDHDSTKKRGQVGNFREKLEHLKSKHGDSLVGIMYFIDPSLRKNENYYRGELADLQSDLGISTYLFYGSGLFEYLQGHNHTWEMLLASLRTWRSSVPGWIRLNYDADPDGTLREVEKVPIGIWHKLLGNDLLWQSDVLQSLFQTGETLRRLDGVFKSRGSEQLKSGRSNAKYTELVDLLELRIRQYYDK